MLPAFPVAKSGGKSKGALLLDIVELAAVSVSTFKVIPPAGAAPLVSALMPTPLSCRASACAVIVMAPGVVAALPPKIIVVM